MPLHRPILRIASFALSCIATVAMSAEPSDSQPVYVPMEKIGDVKVIASSKSPDDNFFGPNFILDEGYQEYASDQQGEETFVDFDLGRMVPVSGFRHQQRKRLPDIVKASELVFSSSSDFSNPTVVPIAHREGARAVTYAHFEPLTARYVRWKVTELGKSEGTSVGGSAMAFFTQTAMRDEAPVKLALSEVKQASKLIAFKGAGIVVESPYLNEIPCILTAAGKQVNTTIRWGVQSVHLPIETPDRDQEIEVCLSVNGTTMARRKMLVHPAQRPHVIYVLPHSHNDNGYTHLQPEIADRQLNNLVQGMAVAKKTAAYPEGSRFVWNLEVAWAADLYQQRMNAEQRKAFEEAVKTGQVALNAMYLNVLTGICRPEELIRVFRFSKTIEERIGVKIDSAMASDVPGQVWGTVTAMNQAGVRYFSTAPNYFDRIGDILVENTSKPFWWIGPDGKSKVLVMAPYMGYAMSNLFSGLIEANQMGEICTHLDAVKYPYDISYIRWSNRGDNAPPDETLPDQVRKWNETYASPKLIIASTHDAFSAFEAKYGEKIPQRRGDWTPYWEDGAASSAQESALNRATSSRLKQVETLFAMLAPGSYSAEKFEDAWRDVLLWSEHTWGAHCSVNQPGSQFTKDQWAFKRGYALSAEHKTNVLLDAAAALRSGTSIPDAVDIYNTSSWPRSEVVIIPAALSKAGDLAEDAKGARLPSQRLSSGELAVQASKIPGFGTTRIFLKQGAPDKTSDLKAEGATLQNQRIKLRVDEKTGAISELFLEGVKSNLMDNSKGGLNSYLYFKGNDNTKLEPVGNVRISIKENGPLLASLLIERDAPGCKSLATEIRLTSGSDTVEIGNLADKARLEAANYLATKESLNFGFPFNVPEGQVRMDIPFGVFRPDLDQIPGSCKNWFSVGSWVDVSNKDHGVTWCTLDAPLVELGELSGNLLGSQKNPKVWRKNVGPTQALYSWVMNNHWGTNYRAYQEGPVMLRYVVRPHQGSSDTEASHLAERFMEPLVLLPAKGKTSPLVSPVRVESATVSAIGLKPSDDGRALILRLFNTAAQPAKAEVVLASKNSTAYLSGTSENRGEKAPAALEFSGYELKSLRIDTPKARGR